MYRPQWVCRHCSMRMAAAFAPKGDTCDLCALEIAQGDETKASPSAASTEEKNVAGHLDEVPWDRHRVIPWAGRDGSDRGSGVACGLLIRSGRRSAG